MPIRNIRTFTLQRVEDESGVSGTGVVAEGVEFSGGTAVLNWLSFHPAVNVYFHGMKTVEALHGHGGKTKIVWDDEVPKTPEEVRRYVWGKLVEMQSMLGELLPAELAKLIEGVKP